jgi:integrase
MPAFKSFQSICGDKPLSEYTLRDVERFKARRLESCEPTTVSIEFRTVKAALSSAVRWEILNANPFLKSKPPRIPDRDPVFLTEEQFGRLLEVVDVPVLRDVFVFAVYTGARQGEILNLSWPQVDLDHRIIRIANTADFTTKSGKGRSLPINNVVFELLSRRALLRDHCEYVFHRNGKRLTQSYVGHRFKRYVRRAGLSEKVRFHSLRHSFASWMVQKGASLYQVQQLLGHSDYRTTQTYAHFDVGSLRSAVNKLNWSPPGEVSPGGKMQSQGDAG